MLSELIKHHVKEEERPGEGVFASARAARDRSRRAGATDSRSAKTSSQRLLKGRAKLPPPETRSYTGHKLVQSKPVEARP